MIPKLKQGQPASAIPVTGWNAIADAINGARGQQGVKITKGDDGALVATLGDDVYSFRQITTVDAFRDESGVVTLVFRNVSVLCSLKSAPVAELRFGAIKDVEGDLTAILLGEQQVPVEACGEEEPPAT